ncbi:ribonuclease H-like domain-containing protein [Tanacetum coccineum]
MSITCRSPSIQEPTNPTELIYHLSDLDGSKPKFVNETIVSKSKINRDEVIIEDWTSDDEDDVCAVKTVSSVKPNVTQAIRIQADKSGQTSQKQGIGFKKSPEPRVKNVVNTRERVVKPVWDYGKRVNHQNFSKNLKYPHAKRTFNPSAVLTRAGLVNTDRSNISTARSISTVRHVNTVRPVYTVRPVSTARPLASKIAQSNSVIRPNHPRLDIVRPKASNSPIKRSYFTQPVYRPKDLKPDVKTFGVKNMTTVGTRAVVSKGKVENVLNKAKWVWRPKMNYQDHVYKYNGSYMLKKFKAIQRACDRINQWWNECLENQLLKSLDVNEFCAKKGIKREFSVARTPQQNGVAERKNRTLIEAARTMLADSLLPIPFWAEAVNTACYVLNRVLVTKPQNKTPYELLIGKSPSISFMRPFGCPLTILNTLDSLGKFDGKSDEGYLLGYSTSSKAFRVYNKRTKRVEENLHINFLEDQPNVAGTGPNWMFDLDFLTNSMNYIPVSVENQVIVDAGTQDSYVAGSSGKDKGPTQEYILLPLQPHRTRIPVKDVVQDAQEQPSENASPDKGIQDSEDVFDKEGHHQMPEDEQV